MNRSEDLNYLNSLLQKSAQNGYPLIYVFWGLVVFTGYALADLKPTWLTPYWVCAMLIGLVVSAWLGRRQNSKSGQRDANDGNRYLLHFGIMMIGIFLAMLTRDYQSILLIVGVSYCLAGLYLERVMLLVGAITLACYLAVAKGLIPSNLVVGIAISSGFFVTAWASSRQNHNNGGLQ